MTATTAAATAPAAAPLPVAPAINEALLLLATLVASRPNAPTTNPVDLLTGAASRDGKDGPHDLLQYVVKAAGLRTRLRRHLTTADLSGEDASTVDILTRLADPDPAVATNAANQIRNLVKDGRRRPRRKDALRPTPTAEDKRAARDQVKLDNARAARERAETQRDHAHAETARVRAELDAVRDEAEQQRDRLTTAQAQLHADRVAAADPRRTADHLAQLLTADPGDDQASARGDERGIQAGEPARVVPGRTPPETADAPPAVTADHLARAATTAGLPPDLARTVTTWLPALLTALAAPPRPPVTTADRTLRVDVLGGLNIGGSCVLVEAGDTRILVDAGTRPGATSPTDQAPPRIAEATRAPIDAIVITHAHMDHAGWAPALLRDAPRTPVITTAATADLLAPMWMDSAKVNAKRSTDPAYTATDVGTALDALVTSAWNRPRTVGDLTIELFPAGHIVGAAGVVVTAENRRVVISGDVSRPGQQTVGGIVLPETAKGADLLLLEATYAAMDRQTPRHKAVADFVRDVETVVERGGRVLVPAFALGRAQEIALTLAEHLPEVPVLVDGLARDITEVYQQHTGPTGQPLRIFTDQVRSVPRGRTRTEVDRFGPGVIVATSGMLNAGPAVTWARHLLPDARNGLFVVGYQDADSPGARLLQLAADGGGTFTLTRPDQPGQDVEVDVAATVGKYGLGAHASADELMMIAAEAAASTVMPVHGDPRAREEMARRLTIRAQPTTTTGTWTPQPA